MRGYDENRKYFERFKYKDEYKTAMGLMYRYKNPWKDKTVIENQNLEYFPAHHHIGHDYKEREF